MLPSRPHVGTYVADHLLGLGSEGVVWRAVGPRGPVALKVARAPEARAALAAEADALRRCPSPHLARFEQAGDGWLVTELVEGRPIHHWAAGRPASEVLPLFLEVLEALRSLHAQGLTLGDLKPAHVLVDDWGHLKIVDVAGKLGTPGFAAPEVLQGNAPTPASDRYAFAATLYAALAGRAPFHTSEPSAALHLPMTTAPLPLSAWRIDVPEQVDRLVATLLLRDPAARPDLDDIEQVLSKAWRLPCRRPVLGMERARALVHGAVCRAADGEPVVLVLYGPLGSGRHTLVEEAVRQATLEGMAVLERFDGASFLASLAAGDRPVAACRSSLAEAHDAARRMKASGQPGLLLLYGASPTAALGDLGAQQVTPDALTCEQARMLGRWLGVYDEAVLDAAWRLSDGMPRALWVALERHASLHTHDREPFLLPVESGRVLDALAAERGRATPARLAEITGLTLPEIGDVCSLLEAAGRLASVAGSPLVHARNTESP